MGIGMALLEETEYDPQNGAPINSSLADYIVAVKPTLHRRSPLPRLSRQRNEPNWSAWHRRDRLSRHRGRHHRLRSTMPQVSASANCR